MNNTNIEPTQRLQLIYEQAQETAKTCVNSAIPINRLVRSSQELSRMIGIYDAEKNYLEAYFLSLKTVFIFQVEIKKHVNFKSLQPNTIQSLKSKVVAALQTAEKTKSKVSQILEKQFIEWKSGEAGRLALENGKKVVNSSVATYNYEQNTQNDQNRKNAQNSTVTNYNIPNFNPPSYNPQNTFTHPKNSSFKTHPKLLYPANLIPTFKQAASQNSNSNIETCGFLFGTVSSNTYSLTHLFIPKQGGTSDTCQPTDAGELEMFDFGSNHNLVCLGWIHTHPSQTSFLSSVDMHTHFSYQSLLPVAIAIVCSIKYDETKFLHLTDLGMKKVREKLNKASSGDFCNYQEERSSLQEDCRFVEGTNQLQVVSVDKRVNFWKKSSCFVMKKLKFSSI